MRPPQLKSLTNPTIGLSTGGGLRKPRASNSAGAAGNGARVVVSDKLKSLKAATSFRKGRLQLPPDDSIPDTGLGQDWATRARCAWGRPIEKAETMCGAQIESVQRCTGGGSSRGLYPCLNRHA